MRFSFAFFLTEQDFLEYNRYYIKETPEQRKRAAISRFLIPIAFMVIGLAAGLSIEPAAIAHIIFFIAALYWLIFFPKIQDRRLKAGVKQLGRQGRIMHEREITMEFYDDHFFVKTDESESKLLYSAIIRIGGGQAGIYLFQSVNMAHIIPLSTFGSRDELAAFWGFINERVQAAKTPAALPPNP